MERIRDEIENENSTWRRSINTMLKHNDLEGLISIRDSEVLDDEVKKYLLSLKKDDKSEEKMKNHCMETFDCLKRMGYDVDSMFKEEES